MNDKSNGELTEIKRVNYYEGQPLTVDDFRDEQDYHIQMRRLHNRGLHSWGIAYGLNVNRESDREISITAGLAIDKFGNEIYTPNEKIKVDVVKEAGNKDGIFFLLVSHSEEESDIEDGQKCNINFSRIKESVKIDMLDTIVEEGIKIPLAKVKIENCKINDDAIDTSVRMAFTGEYIRKRGDVMSGPLIIDRYIDRQFGEDFASVEKIESFGEVNLHLVTSRSNDGPYISTNKDKIGLRSLNVANETSGWASLEVKDVYTHGKVGIGTSDPKAALDVRGFIINGGSDFKLGIYDGRGQGNKKENRALVHTDSGIGTDNLIINYDGDFEGGVHIQGPKTIIEGSLAVKQSTIIEGSLTAKINNVNRILGGNPARYVRTVWLFADDNTDTKEVDLGTVRNFYAFVAMTGCDPRHNFDRGDAFALDIFKIDGNKTSPWISGGDHWGVLDSDTNVFAQHYIGTGRKILFRARSVQDATVHGIGVVFYE